ncbi:MAG: hypothetical protein A2Z32_13890 [Chloroflexi bacterium RBG_16_69_14]|nr:MAG: hypothetical protein A2Z32_13890 [Chloroflexi bacterium RBG_16_69_14]
MLRSGADTAAVVEKARKRDGVKADRSYARAFRGFSAKLDEQQRIDLLADPNVVAVVPDGVVQLTQTVPTGVARVGGRQSDVAAIDGTDHRVDADVAIVDTGITYHPDLNVAGGYNCSTADRTAWRDRNDHGTHVAGTVAALDNSFGVVGVAPGARVWAVKILNDDGYGLISWYICGLDWILAQRDPNDASRPLFEAVNMSVTKAGSDDGNCGFTNSDPLHQAICRLVAGGVTVVAAAANDSHNAAKNIPASYNEVITVSALADTDGKPGGLGGNRCYSWGTYDKDDTFANFSNYGGDVDIIAPGKCILSTIPGPGYAYLSGTSMAAPTVAGAVALYKESRPNATPSEVREALRYLGNLYWAVSTDPDGTHEPLLDVSRIRSLGVFDFAPAGPTAAPVEAGTTAQIPVHLVRSSTFFERVRISITSLPDGWFGTPVPASLLGWTADTGRLSVVVPKDTPLGRYDIGVQATNQWRTKTTTLSVEVVQDAPTATPPISLVKLGTKVMLNAVWADVAWAPATDPTSAIAGYEVETSRNGGPWASTLAGSAAQRTATFLVGFDASYRFRVRAVDAAGHWSPWAVGAVPMVVHPVDDRSSSISRAGRWARGYSASPFRTTVTGSSRTGDTLTMTFTGHGVAVVGPRNPRRGSAKVYIDGVYVKTIFMWSRTGSSRQVAFTRSFPAGGTHRITLRVVGGGSHPLFRLDAFVVSR